MATTKASLPRVIDVLGESDYGEYGAALCPHCGAKGRYIKHLLLEDGSEAGAMAGCFKMFPKHPVVAKIDYYQSKWKDYDQRGWSLSRFDQQIYDAIERMRAGKVTADDVMQTIRTVGAQRNRYRKNRRGW